MKREEHQPDNTNKKLLKNKLKQKLYELSCDKKVKSTTLSKLIIILERLK